MINYMKSENYRLFRKKGLHITSGVGFLLIIAAAAILYFTGQHESNFPYANSSFFYANVIGNNILILIIAFLFNLRSEKHTSERQSRGHLVCRLLIVNKKLLH